MQKLHFVFFILSPQTASLLNKKSELFTKCRHETKFFVTILNFLFNKCPSDIIGNGISETLNFTIDGRWSDTTRPGLPVSFPQMKSRQNSSGCTKVFFCRNYFLLIQKIFFVISLSLRNQKTGKPKASTRMKTKKTKMLLSKINKYEDHFFSVLYAI